MTLLVSSPGIPTVADLLERLGGIPADRVRYYPLPGTATEQDVLDVEAREDRLCELVDGVLVEKPMAYDESFIAVLISTNLNQFVLPRKLGMVTGESGMVRLFPGMVRIPDVAFVSRDQLPRGRPTEPIPSLAPNLAVEVLSESNTKKEMDRKRGEYFSSGVQLLWIVDPRARTVAVYTDPENLTVLTENDVLDGGKVLPGFTMEIRTLFADPMA